MTSTPINHSGASAGPRPIHRVLILGHNGFIGSALCNYFRKQSPELELIGRSFPEIDLTRPQDAVALATLLRPDTAVIMCSAIKRQFGDTLDVFSQNLAMVMNLARVLQDQVVARLIYFSSAAVYGEDVHNIAITEETAVAPTSYYGIAKFTSECILKKVLAMRNNPELVIIRPPLVYGPGDVGNTYGPSGFIHAALHGEPITLWGDGSELREFLFLPDLLAIVHKLTFCPFHGVLDIASGQSYSFRTILDQIAALAPALLDIRSRSRTKSKVDNAFDNILLRRVFPDFAFTELNDGLKMTMQTEQKDHL
ncbi:MAG: NAD(P)-dependent oxidoreductase [Kiritimatiellaeota bacterium]|nr:NAD(P)-dependent oxidoreductase [Kiritimatiellota bacterium]